VRIEVLARSSSYQPLGETSPAFVSRDAPEAWMHGAGGTTSGFPFLSGVGRLIVKDLIMLGAAALTMTDSAKSYLDRRTGMGKKPYKEKDSPEIAII
jgi:hypothetical protein